MYGCVNAVGKPSVLPSRSVNDWFNNDVDSLQPYRHYMKMHLITVHCCHSSFSNNKAIEVVYECVFVQCL